MATPPCLAGLPVPTHATGDELLIHAFTAVLPPDGNPGSDLINDPNATTRPSYGAQPSARPSRDATTMSATIARGPPLYNCGNNKALAQTRASYVSISFRCPRLARIELFGEEYERV